MKYQVKSANMLNIIKETQVTDYNSLLTDAIKEASQNKISLRITCDHPLNAVNTIKALSQLVKNKSIRNLPIIYVNNRISQLLQIYKQFESENVAFYIAKKKLCTLGAILNCASCLYNNIKCRLPHSLNECQDIEDIKTHCKSNSMCAYYYMLQNMADANIVLTTYAKLISGYGDLPTLNAYIIFDSYDGANSILERVPIFNVKYREIEYVESMLGNISNLCVDNELLRGLLENKDILTVVSNMEAFINHLKNTNRYYSGKKAISKLYILIFGKGYRVNLMRYKIAKILQNMNDQYNQMEMCAKSRAQLRCVIAKWRYLLRFVRDSLYENSKFDDFRMNIYSENGQYKVDCFFSSPKSILSKFVETIKCKSPIYLAAYSNYDKMEMNINISSSLSVYAAVISTIAEYRAVNFTTKCQRMVPEILNELRRLSNTKPTLLLCQSNKCTSMFGADSDTLFVRNIWKEDSYLALFSKINAMVVLGLPLKNIVCLDESIKRENADAEEMLGKSESYMKGEISRATTMVNNVVIKFINSGHPESLSVLYLDDRYRQNEDMLPSIRLSTANVLSIAIDQILLNKQG